MSHSPFYSALGLLIALMPTASSSAQSPRQAGSGEQIAITGARAIDHAGFTVPDLEQAITFFTDVLGAAVLWRSAPFSPVEGGLKHPTDRTLIHGHCRGWSCYGWDPI